jgi:phosphate:Na+ symporter
VESNIILINLVGAVALLLWGLNILTGGVQRAFGSRLRRFLASGTRNRFAAFGSGLLVTTAIQSSTATAMMIASFVAEGFVTPVMAQAVLLGANVGTSLVTQILALDIHWLSPALIFAGLVVFKSSRATRRIGIGETLLGLGLMLLSLQLLGQATVPMRESPALAQLLALLSDAPLIAMLAAAMLSAAASSSLVAVLFIMSLAGASAIDGPLCLVLVAGANLGGAVPPFMAAISQGPVARQVAFSNLLVRGLGALLVTATAWTAATPLAFFSDLPQLVIWSHIAFNLFLALVFLPLLGPLSALVGRVLPAKTPEADGPRHLDEAALSTPASALAAAMRESLRVGDTVEAMLSSSLTALIQGDEVLCKSISTMDNKVDRLQEAIKFYLSRLGRESLDPAEARRAAEIISYAINLEHIGDIIDKNLAQLAMKKIRNQVTFSDDGFAEIEAFYHQTLENLHTAQTVFIGRDIKLARKLVEGKVDIRNLERRSADNHLKRLQEGKPESIQTSSLHLDILRDLKRINAHIASVAYPILDELGELRESRLRSAKRN